MSNGYNIFDHGPAAQASNDVFWQQYGFARCPIFIITPEGKLMGKTEEDKKIIHLLIEKYKRKLISKKIQFPIVMQDEEGHLSSGDIDPGRRCNITIEDGKLVRLETGS
jgi:hypothetical protein